MENLMLSRLQKYYGFTSIGRVRIRFDYIIKNIYKKIDTMEISRLDALKILRMRLDDLIEEEIIRELDEDSEEVTE